MRGLAKVVTADEAIEQIPSGATVASGGFVSTSHPELLTSAIERRFLKTGTPRDLTLVYAAGQGDREHRGVNHFGHEGLVRRVIGGHWNLAPKLGQLAMDNLIEAYNLPQGVICGLYREIAAKRPGIITRVGMDTFIDPQHGGGKLNSRTQEDLIQRIRLGNDDWLWYPSFPIHVSLLKGTRADRQGNVSLEDEGMIGDALSMAQAAKNHGGQVMVQVEEIVDVITDPKSIRIPGILVDFLVIGKKEDQWQTFSEKWNPLYVQRSLIPVSLPKLEFSERKIIGRRALREISSGDIVNLGIGLPEMISQIASEEGSFSDFTLTVESGPIGGIPSSGLSFGCSSNPEAIVDQTSQFDFYDGGGLDISALGAAEIDSEGSVNITRFAGRFAGVGGFVNISSNTRKIVFCCTFTVGRTDLRSNGKSLLIQQDGRRGKFVRKISEVGFHGPSALKRGQKVLYVTERAVFELTEHGLKLLEIAPGISLERDILDKMDFRPLIDSPKLMSPSLFSL